MIPAAHPDTPAVLIDMAVVKRNIARAQQLYDGWGIKFRPHIKTHKLPLIAKMQIEAGAVGITCQKIGEAEIMADAGIDDILITYNIIGDRKLEHLFALSRKCRLSVTTDNLATAEGLSLRFAGVEPLDVLIECDTGHQRCGVQTPQEALELAQQIAALPGLQFCGLMTYPAPDDMPGVDRRLRAIMDCLEAEGLECPVISCGGTPNLELGNQVTCATEHRAGTYVYNDRSLIERGVCGIDDCALRVFATIVSRPTPERAIIDAGSKILTSDLLGLKDHGLVCEAPDARIAGLSEEHGVIDLTSSSWQPEIGEVISIIPNHACVVTNMVDHVHLLQADGTIEAVEVAARGRLS